MTPVFDFVIVGAGAAGCVLANRLSADPSHSVLLIEAGPKDNNFWIHFPLGLQFALRNPAIEWRLATEPERHMTGRKIPIPRGRTLGGSSAMNGMVYIRGQAQDYDDWAQQGCTGWAWKDVLPYFLRSEGNLDLPASTLHGTEGPLQVTTPKPGDKLCEAIIRAGQTLGLPVTQDFNGAEQEGIGYYQHTLAGRWRCSAARAYLKPVRHRKNLTVWTDTQALKFSTNEGRVKSLQVRRGGQELSVNVNDELLVCAGAIHSPQLLQCSGFGDGMHLQSLGIPLQHHIGQVGQNLQDHIQARLIYTLNEPLSLNDLYRQRLKQFTEVLRWFFSKSGRLAGPPIRTGLFAKSSPQQVRPDLQFHFIEFTSDGMGQDPHPYSAFQSAVCLLRPKSRGHVLAGSASMLDAPKITGNFLSDPEDMARTLDGVRLARELAQQAALRGIVKAELQPGPGCVDENGLKEWVRKTAVTVYHPVGTCRMGDDEHSVVDLQLRLRGVKGVRVVDASVMPKLISGNTNAPVMMIAEKAAELIAQR